VQLLLRLDAVSARLDRFADEQARILPALTVTFQKEINRLSQEVREIGPQSLHMNALDANILEQSCAAVMSEHAYANPCAASSPTTTPEPPPQRDFHEPENAGHEPVVDACAPEDLPNHQHHIAEHHAEGKLHHLSQVIAEDVEEELPHWAWLEHPALMKVIRHPAFDATVGILILTNTAVIGWEVNDDAVNPGSSNGLIQGVQTLFNSFFALELFFRMFAERLSFFTCKDKVWNLLDLALVGSSMFMVVVMAIASSARDAADKRQQFQTMRLLRIARCVRVLRIFRVSRFVEELRLMLFLIMCSFRSLLWVFVLLIGVMYIFAIVFTKAGAEYMLSVASGHDVPVDGLSENYGTVLGSMFTLLKAAFGGGDWAELMKPLWDAGYVYGIIFLLYELFMLLAVLNIVTGVFVDNTTKLAQGDKDRVIQEEMDSYNCSVKDLRELFLDVMHEQGAAKGIETQQDLQNLTITRSDFEEILTHEKMEAYFRVLGLDISEGRVLFGLLDTDGDGNIGVEDFTSGCLRLRGGAKEIDIMTLIQGNKRVIDRVSDLIKATHEEVADVLSQTRLVHETEKRMLAFHENALRQAP